MKLNYAINLLLLLFISWDNNDNIEFELTNGVVISNVTILTSNKDYNPFQGNVVIEGDSIIYSGKDTPKVSGVYEKVDGKGKFLIPGLIDNHVHITYVNGMSEEQVEKYPEMVRAFKAQLPKSYLYFGFTTLIDLMALDIEDIHEFQSQTIRPDLYHAGGSPAAFANGYPMNFFPDNIRFDLIPDFIYLESEAERIPKKYLPKDHSPKAVIKRIKETGAIAVKAFYEPGFNPNDPRLPVPTKLIMKEMLTQANNMDLTLTVHGNSLEAHSFYLMLE